jgi:hypothetical protein
MLLEAPDPASRLPSNSLLADSAARLVSAATVETMLAVELTVELDMLLELAAVPEFAATRLLLTLPIDIMIPIATAAIWVIGRDLRNLRTITRPAAAASQRCRELEPSANEGAQGFFGKRFDHQGIKSSVPCVRGSSGEL